MAKKKELHLRSFYGKGLPKVSLKGASGFFVCIDGAECSGCSTQVKLVREIFERAGYPTMQVGLGTSEFIGNELQELLKNTFLTPHTLALFHATDLADQLENKIIPALHAGFVVIADRYLLSALFRGAVRGLSLKWLKEIYGFGLIPDLSIVLIEEPEILAQRCFSKSGALGFWESGRDSFVNGDIYEGFLEYQASQQTVIKKISRIFHSVVIPGDKGIDWIYAKILGHIDRSHGKVPRLEF